MKLIRPFHIAIPVSDLQKSKQFYENILGCTIGRSNHDWVDINFFSHQLVIHKKKTYQKEIFNVVDEKNIPIPHFGVILNWNEWKNLAENFKNRIDFIVEPYIRFKGKIGEQATMFLFDPDMNVLEFKAFKDDNQIFNK